MDASPASRHAMSSTTKGVLAVLGGVALLAGGVLAGVWLEKPAKASSPKPGPNTTPVWQPVAPNADGSITVPAGTTFALSVLSTSPNFATFTADMTAALAAGAVTSSQGFWPVPLGSAAPPGWPAADQGGTLAARYSGVSGSAGWTLSAADAAGASVWIVTGYV